MDAGKAAGYKTELLTVKVGSRGMLGIPLPSPYSSSEHLNTIVFVVDFV